MVERHSFRIAMDAATVMAASSGRARAIGFYIHMRRRAPNDAHVLEFCAFFFVRRRDEPLAREAGEDRGDRIVARMYVDDTRNRRRYRGASRRFYPELMTREHR